jgi:NAD(P)-dependent dehydrogenase (short-subunit alcohol dehydrogenase family)
MRTCYDVNVFGVVTLTDAFIPLLEKSDFPRIINVSSPLGSIDCQLTPGKEGYGALYLVGLLS